MRCKACDSILRDEEIIYREEQQRWEDLCRNCRGKIYDDNDDLDLVSLGIDIVEDIGHADYD